MNLFKSDLIRFYGKDCLTMKELLLFPYELRWLWSFRMASKYKRNNPVFAFLYSLSTLYQSVTNTSTYRNKNRCWFLYWTCR